MILQRSYKLHILPLQRSYKLHNQWVHFPTGVNKFPGGNKPLRTVQHGKLHQQIYQYIIFVLHNYWSWRLETKYNYLMEAW